MIENSRTNPGGNVMTDSLLKLNAEREHWNTGAGPPCLGGGGGQQYDQ